MKPEDKVAFEAAWERHSATRPVMPGDKALCGTFYELALAHRDAQPAGAQGEPVAFCVEFADDLFGRVQLGMPTMNRSEAEAVAALIPSRRRVVELIRNHPAPAAAINEQLLEALKILKRIGPKGWETSPEAHAQMKLILDFEDHLNAAIAAAEAEKAKGAV